jgi:carboxypeptidase C (cathepsin A)
MSRVSKVVLLPLSLIATLAFAAEPAPPAPAKGADTPAAAAAEAPKPEQSSTDHSVVIGGRAVAYTASAGTLLLRDEKDEPSALVGYTAYTLKGVTDKSRRAITFAYNGGPGSSSLWLHMGVLGPRRISTLDPEFNPPPPYKVVDNNESIVDATDLVMIDPVGTGYSHAVGKRENKEFWGTDPDIESVSRFIYQYVSDNGRWNSPKYLLGESYGTTRSAGVALHLHDKWGMDLNGVVLVSVALDLEAIFGWPGNERPFPMFVPTYAATAWYHKKLPHPPADFHAFLDEVRAWSLGDYTVALAKGDRLPDAERNAVAAKLHEYTGLSVDYILQANLRVSEPQFTQELMRSERKNVGRLDSRFTGFIFDRHAEEAEYDPQSEAISPAFTAAFLDYYGQELKFGAGKTYKVSGEVFRDWDFKHKIPGAFFPLPMANTGPDLALAMGTNPHLKVLVLNGYYDLATPFLASEYMFDHLGLSKELASNVEMKYYEAGHMMYVHDASLKQFKADVAGFIQRTMGTPAIAGR